MVAHRSGIILEISRCVHDTKIKMVKNLGKCSAKSKESGIMYCSI